MSTVRVNDVAIWIKHIEGDERLKQRIASLKAGEIVDLEIGGVIGKWQRMNDGTDGRPTPGIKPISSTKEAWAELRRRKSGALVEIREVTMVWQTPTSRR